MRFIYRIFGAVLFVVFFGFALKNTQEAALRLFFDYEIRGPLVLLLLAFFVAGAVLGVLAMLPTVLRYRRQLSRQKNVTTQLEQEREAERLARTQPPQPDSVTADN